LGAGQPRCVLDSSQLTRGLARARGAKVSRADLRADLRHERKRKAYLGMAGAVWYVLGRDARGRAIGGADDVPIECGVLLEAADGWQVLREAPRRAVPALAHHVWLALAQASPAPAEEPLQARL